MSALPFQDRTDFDDADRGFVGALDPCVVHDKKGKVVWDNDSYAFVNGDCPDGYPVKANDNSGIYHVPGGRFYDRTVAERCYANADDALADGYRPAKA